MKSENAVIAVILLVFSVFYGYLTWRLPPHDQPHTIGAAFMPWVLTICMVFLSLLLLRSGVSETGKKGNPRPMRLLREVLGIAGLLLVIGLYILSLPYLGFIIGSMVFLAALAVICGARKVLEIVPFSVVAGLAIYLLFQYFFGVPLPRGVIL